MNVLTELCFFTYFLLNDQMYDVFDTLAYQFQIAQENHTLDKNTVQDFFDMCNRCFYDMWTDSNEKNKILKIILRMIGLVSINKECLDRYYRNSIEFTNRIMFSMQENFNILYQSVEKEEEWILFRHGLVMLLCIELLKDKSNSSNENKIIFLQQISDENQRQDMANELLHQLHKLDQPIFGNSNWTDLFTMVHPTKIDINQLNLTDSFKTLITCVTKVSKVLTDYSNFEENIADYLENRILNNCLQGKKTNFLILLFRNFCLVHTDSIRFLLDFLKEDLPDDPAATKHLLSTVQAAIRTSAALKNKIRDCFNKLGMTMENMEDLWLILCLISKSEILSYIDKYEYLENSLLDVYDPDYYVKWSECLLANTRITDDIEKKKCEKLLKRYSDCLNENYMHFTHVLNAIDDILKGFNNPNDDDWFRLHFINCIVDLCFDRGMSLIRYLVFQNIAYLDSIFVVLDDGLFHVENKLFRVQFRKRFDLKYLIDKQQDIFKDIDNEDNPLLKLIELDQRKTIKSILVRDLIELISEKIEMTKYNLIQDTFYQPNKSTLTYRVLFDQSFVTLQIYIKIIEQLFLKWDEWEAEGFHVMEINSWSALNPNQQQVACQIWNLIGENLGKTMRFEQLIDEAKRKIEDITKTIENVTLCINNYCQDTCDRNYYLTHLQNLRNQLNRTTISYAKISKEIELLKPSADRLQPVFSSCVWQTYFKQNVESKSKLIFLQKWFITVV